MTIPEKFFVVPNDPDVKFTVPSMCFLIQHTGKDDGKTSRIVFDLGLRRDLKLYPEPIQKHCENRQPMSTSPDVVESLKSGGLDVNDIDFVIFSHVHYDHIGLPRDFTSPNTKFTVGPGSLDLLSGKTSLKIGSHSFFESDLLPPERTIELPSPVADSWQPLGCFPHTIDYFNDGSVYIVNAPGHLPGHINLLCKLSDSPRKYCYLAGDACHDIRLFTGERDIATWKDAEGNHCCIYADIEQTKKTLERMRKAAKEGLDPGDGRKGEVEVIFAHNWAWEKEAKENGRFWPGKL